MRKFLATRKPFVKVRPSPPCPPMKPLRLLLAAMATLLSFSASAADDINDADLEKVAEEYVKGWLAAHPLTATSLGFHEYDGRISDYTRLSIDAELSRLKRFDKRLGEFDATKLKAAGGVQLRILQAAIRRDLFENQDAAAFYRHETGAIQVPEALRNPRPV